MSLTVDEQRDVRKIIYAFYGRSAPIGRPTIKTLELVEKVLLEVEKCNSRVSRLLRSVPCAVVRRGFLRRCLRAVVSAISKESISFHGCTNVAAAKWKSAILFSTL